MSDHADVAVEVRSVDDAQRVAQILVCRYGETSRRTPRPERFLPGAFTKSVNVRRDRIPFTSRHTDGTGMVDSKTNVARAVAWDTSDPGELRATIKFYDTPDAWEVYRRARDREIDGGSVGFQPIEERTGPDGVREIVRAQMHHFALLSRAEAVPAYDGPRVLELRRATPSLDWIDPARADACVDWDQVHRMVVG